MRTVHPRARIKIFIGTVCKLLAYRDTESKTSPFMIDYIKSRFVSLILLHFFFLGDSSPYLPFVAAMNSQCVE